MRVRRGVGLTGGGDDLVAGGAQRCGQDGADSAGADNPDAGHLTSSPFVPVPRWVPDYSMTSSPAYVAGGCRRNGPGGGLRHSRVTGRRPHLRGERWNETGSTRPKGVTDPGPTAPLPCPRVETRTDIPPEGRYFSTP